mgnify:CR=1 FL=1
MCRGFKVPLKITYNAVTAFVCLLFDFLFVPISTLLWTVTPEKTMLMTEVFFAAFYTRLI